MSSLSAEQVKELTTRINSRFAEFDIEGSRVFEWVTPGMVRLVHDVIEEWQCANPQPMVELSAPGVADTDMVDGYHIGWERGRAALRDELGLLEQARPHGKLWVGPHNIDPGIELNVEKYWKPLTGTHPDAPAIHIDGNDQIRADIRDHTAYPRLDIHPNGMDVFADVQPVTGAPEQSLSVIAVADDPLRFTIQPPLATAINTTNTTDGHHADELPELSTATVVTLGAAHTGGNGHHAEPSPAAVATLGPEHMVVTPLVPRRPRTLAEVDGIEDDETDSRPTRAKLPVVTREQLIAELKRQAMAGAMPTRPAFDLAKPAVWPKAQMLTIRLNVRWTDLAREAGLKLVRR